MIQIGKFYKDSRIIEAQNIIRSTKPQSSARLSNKHTYLFSIQMMVLYNILIRGFVLAVPLVNHHEEHPLWTPGAIKRLHCIANT